jgi:CRISPR-associated protein Cas1
VKNRDPENIEAQAARIYFGELAPSPGFIRAREGPWPNAALNYGYAILRAAMARALVGSGLICLKGIHHHNRYNAFALADDMMEPYRPFVDQYVLGKVKPFDGPADELTREMRARLLEMLTCDVKVGDVRRPLSVALTFSSASLARYYLGKADALALPEFVT